MSALAWAPARAPDAQRRGARGYLRHERRWARRPMRSTWSGSAGVAASYGWIFPAPGPVQHRRGHRRQPCRAPQTGLGQERGNLRVARHLRSQACPRAQLLAGGGGSPPPRRRCLARGARRAARPAGGRRGRPAAPTPSPARGIGKALETGCIAAEGAAAGGQDDTVCAVQRADSRRSWAALRPLTRSQSLGESPSLAGRPGDLARARGPHAPAGCRRCSMNRQPDQLAHRQAACLLTE